MKQIQIPTTKAQAEFEQMTIKLLNTLAKLSPENQTSAFIYIMSLAEQERRTAQ